MPLPLLQLALLLVGCGVVRSEGSIEADVQHHLQATYGEEFEVTLLAQARGTHGEPSLKDAHRFAARPVADPSLEISGLADYRGPEPQFIEDYRCAQVRSWLVAHLEQALGPRHRLTQSDVLCHRTRTPPHPGRGQPLPERAVTLRTTLNAFGEGDPEQVVQRARADLLRATRALSVKVEGPVVAIAPGAWPTAKQWRGPGPGIEGAMDWGALILAQSCLDEDDPVTKPARDSALEATIAATLQQAHPKARIGVWAHPGPIADQRVIDVRLAEPGLDPSALEHLFRQLEPQLRTHKWTLTGLDKAGPESALGVGFVCRSGPPCVETGGPFIDPLVLQAPQ